MAMKLNLAYPQNGSQKLIELDDEKKTRLFYDRRLAEEVPADALGDEFKGYIVKITGGHDKQGFAMKQGVLLNHRTRLLLDGTTSGFHPWKRPGHRKRKSVRGCIIGPDIAVINAIIVKKGIAELPGLTDPNSVKPSLRGPKRANNIRKLWGLTKEDDVRQFVSRKKIKDGKNGKPRYKSPKIQRLITPVMLHRKKRRLAIKKKRYEKSKKEAADYAALLANIRREKRKALIEKRRALSERKSERKSERLSQKAESKEKTTKAAPAKAGKGKDEKAAKTDAKGAKGKAPATKQTSKGELPKGKDQAAKGKDQPAKGKAPATKQASKGELPKGKDQASKGKDQPAKGAEAKGKTPAKQTSKGEIPKAQPATKQTSKGDVTKTQPAKGTDKPAKDTGKDTGKVPVKQTKSEPAPKTEKPAAKPAEKPAAKPAEKPAAKPAAEKPAAKPAAEKPAAKPAAEKPAAKPAAEKPAAEKPAQKPAAQKPAQPKQGPGDKRPPEGGDKGPNKKPKK